VSKSAKFGNNPIFKILTSESLTIADSGSQAPSNSKVDGQI